MVTTACILATFAAAVYRETRPDLKFYSIVSANDLRALHELVARFTATHGGQRPRSLADVAEWQEYVVGHSDSRRRLLESVRYFPLASSTNDVLAEIQSPLVGNRVLVTVEGQVRQEFKEEIEPIGAP